MNRVIVDNPMASKRPAERLKELITWYNSLDFEADTPKLRMQMKECLKEMEEILIVNRCNVSFTQIKVYILKYYGPPAYELYNYE